MLTADQCAPQHRRAPRPLPLFLAMLRDVAQHDPALAERALAGLKAYQTAPEPPPSPVRPEVARVRGATLRDAGGSGRQIVLVPSLINPPAVVDLDAKVSLAGALARDGHVLILDWGPASERLELDVAGHVTDLLVPLLAKLGEPPALVGYCLGGTMAAAAAELAPVRRIATLAAPWRFAAYPAATRTALGDLVRSSEAIAEQLQVLPMEVLQTAFWGLDPERVVGKFADFARLDPASAEAERFIRIERWANGGEPLPLPAARELAEDFFGNDRPGRGEWRVGNRIIVGTPACPGLHLTALDDRIAPADAAPPGPRIGFPTGHVGLVIGRCGLAEVHPRLAAFLHTPA